MQILRSLLVGLFTVTLATHAVNQWSRSVFNGLAQVIVQSERNSGEIKLTARAEGLMPATVTIRTKPDSARPAAP